MAGLGVSGAGIAMEIIFPSFRMFSDEYILWDMTCKLFIFVDFACWIKKKSSELETNLFCILLKRIKSLVVVSNIFYFHPYLGKIPILTILFRWVETTNK